MSETVASEGQGDGIGDAAAAERPTLVAGVVACQGCDALFRKGRLRQREVARCPRCGSELDRHGFDQRRRLLPLTVACLVLFIISNAFPIVEIEVQGRGSQTTLFGAVLALMVEGRSSVALLVLSTTMLFPFMQLCFLTYLLTTGAGTARPPGFAWLVRGLQSLQPWGMIEVFVLGILVALVKLGGIATVIAGPALWSMMVLVVLLTAVLSFDPRFFWEMTFDVSDDVDKPDADPRASGVAASVGPPA